MLEYSINQNYNLSEQEINKQKAGKRSVKVQCTSVVKPLINFESVVNACSADFKLPGNISPDIKRKLNLEEVLVLRFDCPPSSKNSPEFYREDRYYMFYFNDDASLFTIDETE